MSRMRCRPRRRGIARLAGRPLIRATGRASRQEHKANQQAKLSPTVTLRPKHTVGLGLGATCRPALEECREWSGYNAVPAAWHGLCSARLGQPITDEVVGVAVNGLALGDAAACCLDLHPPALNIRPRPFRLQSLLSPPPRL